MHLWFGLGVDANVQVKQMRVDGRGHVSCLWVSEKYAIMRSAPDRHPATFTAKPREIVLKALTLLAPSVLVIETAIRLDEGRAAGFEKVHLLARSEYIGSELGDVPDRPGQQRRYDRLGNARCPVLADVTIARDASWCTSGPRLK